MIPEDMAGSIIAWVFLLVLVAVVVLALLHKAFASRVKPWFLSMVVLAAVVWFAIGQVASADTKHPIFLVQIAGLAFYFTGCLIVMESLSLLSRGISLRVLIDLLERADPVEASQLETAYGGGMGLKGLLHKRLGSMVTLGLVTRRGDEVGPLSARGRWLGVLTAKVRDGLKLGEVG